MRFLLAGVLLMAGCFMMAATFTEQPSGKALINASTRTYKATGCGLAIVALCLAAWRTSADRMAESFYQQHQGELMACRWQLESLRKQMDVHEVRRADDEVPF